MTAPARHAVGFGHTDFFALTDQCSFKAPLRHAAAIQISLPVRYTQHTAPCASPPDAAAAAAAAAGVTSSGVVADNDYRSEREEDQRSVSTRGGASSALGSPRAGGSSAAPTAAAGAASSVGEAGTGRRKKKSGASKRPLASSSASASGTGGRGGGAYASSRRNSAAGSSASAPLRRVHSRAGDSETRSLQSRRSSAAASSSVATSRGTARSAGGFSNSSSTAGGRGRLTTAAAAARRRRNHDLDVALLTGAGGLRRMLWTAAQDGAIEVRSAAEPNYVIAVVPPANARSIVTVIAQAGRERVLAGYSDGLVAVFDGRTLEKRCEARALSGAVMGLVACVAENTAAVAGTDGSLSLWELRGLHLIGYLHRDPYGRHGFTSLTAVAGGTFLVSGDGDGVLRLWSVRGRCQVEVGREDKAALRANAPDIRRRLTERESGTPAVGSLNVSGVSVGGTPMSARGGGGGGGGAKSPRLEHSQRGKLPTAPGKPKLKKKGKKHREGGQPQSHLEDVVMRLDAHLTDFRRAAAAANGHSLFREALALRYLAAYDDPYYVCWPVYAHKSNVTALAAIEDRLLVSASKDCTARVFALPSGELIRNLQYNRLIPLSSVVVDHSETHRLFLGSTDGMVSAYQIDNDFALLFQLPPAQMTFSCVFVPIAQAPMNRFLIGRCRSGPDNGAAAEGEAAAAPIAASASAERAGSREAAGVPPRGAVPPRVVHSVMSLAQMSRRVMAHGPNSSVSSYRVGEPSLRELALAMETSKAQAALAEQRRLQELFADPAATRAGLLAQAARWQGGLGVAARETLVLLARRFWLWRRWAARTRAARERRAVLQALLSRGVEQRLRGAYYARWVAYCRAQRTQLLETQQRLVEEVARGAAGAAQLFDSGAVARTRRDRQRAVVLSQMSRACEQRLLRSYLRRWISKSRAAVVAQRRETAFNKLLLLFGSSSAGSSRGVAAALSSPSAAWNQIAVATRRRQEQRAAAVALQAANGAAVALALQRQYLRYWLLFYAAIRQRRLFATTGATPASASDRVLEVRLESVAAEAVSVNANAAAWVVEEQPLCRPSLLLRRYFALWMLQTCYRAKAAMAEEERAILGDEWGLCQQALVSDASTQQLLEEKAEIEGVRDKDLRTLRKYRTKEAKLTEQLERERGQLLLSTLSAGYRFSSQPRVSAGSGTSAKDDGGVAPWYFTVEADAKQEGEAAAVYGALRTLKGLVLQVGRDDKLVLAASDAVAKLRLRAAPALDGSLNLSGSFSSLAVPARTMSSTTTTPRRRASGIDRPAASGLAAAAASSYGGASTPRDLRRHTAAGPTPQARAKRSHSSPKILAESSDDAPVRPRNNCGAAAAAAAAEPEHQRQQQQQHPSWAGSPRAKAYRTLAEAFDDHLAQLQRLFTDLERQYRVATAVVGGELSGGVADGATPGDSRQPAAATPEEASAVVAAEAATVGWVRRVPVAQRREALRLVAMLVALFDSFVAHDESGEGQRVPPGSALPLRLLCSPESVGTLASERLLPVVVATLSPRALPERRALAATAVGLEPLEDAYYLSAASLARVRSPRLTAPDAAVLPVTTTHRPPSVSRACAPRSSAGHSTTAANSGSTSPVTRPAPQPQPRPQAAAAGSPPAGMPQLNLASLTGAAATHTPRDASPTPRGAGAPSPGGSAATTPRSSVVVGGPRTPRSSSAAAAAFHTRERPYLGFRVAVSRDTADAPGGSGEAAILVRDVAATYVTSNGAEARGPAAAAGVMAGDRLQRFAGYAVTDLAAFNAIVSRHVRAGAELPISLLRAGRVVNTTIVVGARPV